MCNLQRLETYSWSLKSAALENNRSWWIEVTEWRVKMAVMVLLEMDESDISHYRCDHWYENEAWPVSGWCSSTRGGAVHVCSGEALIPCCPTFADGLNLCPQLRRINPASADIISCFTLWHRMQEVLPTSRLQTITSSAEGSWSRSRSVFKFCPKSRCSSLLCFSTALVDELFCVFFLCSLSNCKLFWI